MTNQGDRDPAAPVSIKDSRPELLTILSELQFALQGLDATGLLRRQIRFTVNRYAFVIAPKAINGDNHGFTVSIAEDENWEGLVSVNNPIAEKIISPVFFEKPKAALDWLSACGVSDDSLSRAADLLDGVIAVFADAFDEAVSDDSSDTE